MKRDEENDGQDNLASNRCSLKETPESRKTKIAKGILSRVRIPDSGTPPDCDILPHPNEGL